MSDPPPLNILFLLLKVNCNDGIASYCETLIAGLSRRQVRCFIASGPVTWDEQTRPRRDALESKSAEWRIYPKLRPIPGIADFFDLVDFIRTNNIRIINVHGLSALLWGKALSATTGARLIATYHPSAWGDLRRVRAMATQTLRPDRRIALNLLFPDKLIVLSEESRRFVEQAAPRFKDRIVKILGGVSSIFRPPKPVERTSARTEFGYGENDLVCLLAGRLSWVKGQDILIDAARLVINQQPDLSLKCLFVGSGGELGEIRNLASSRELQQGIFKFIGYRSRIERAMWAADIIVLPSRFEGFALVIAEAMATGLVPIRTPSGGAMDQIVDGETGLLVPFENPDALARAIMVLSDPEKRSAMSARCIARASRLFSADAMCGSIGAVYTELSSSAVR
jgi:glycosyltransferase involved in cell wall biosynthesis